MNRVHQLSDIEREALRQLYRETKQADVRSRCDMILLSDQGLSPPKIAERVHFSSRTVLRYIERPTAERLTPRTPAHQAPSWMARPPDAGLPSLVPGPA
jgi:transposase